MLNLQAGEFRKNPGHYLNATEKNYIKNSGEGGMCSACHSRENTICCRGLKGFQDLDRTHFCWCENAGKNLLTEKYFKVIDKITSTLKNRMISLKIDTATRCHITDVI